MPMNDISPFLNKRLAVDAARLEALRDRLGREIGRLSRGPRLLFSGQATAIAVARTLPSAAPLTVTGSGLGSVQLQPGTIWGGERILVSVDTIFTHYCVGNNYYEWSTSDFIREEWFIAEAKAVGQAEFIIRLAKIEIALLQGLLVPWYILLAVSAAGLGLNIYHRRDLYASAIDQAPLVLQLLGDIRERCPTLYSLLRKTILDDMLANLPAGITAEDIAFLLGRLIRNMAIGTYLSLVLAAVVVSLTRIPAIAGRALREGTRVRAAELQQELIAAGLPATRQDAETIMREIEANPDTLKKLQDLHKSVDRLLPILEQISRTLPHQ
jgi:hypothetical protein